MENEIADELTRVTLAIVIFVTQKFQQVRAFLLPHAVSIFLDIYPQAKDNEELYLELGVRGVKFSARCIVNDHLSSAMHELHMCGH